MKLSAPAKKKKNSSHWDFHFPGVRGKKINQTHFFETTTSTWFKSWPNFIPDFFVSVTIPTFDRKGSRDLNSPCQKGHQFPRNARLQLQLGHLFSAKNWEDSPSSLHLPSGKLTWQWKMDHLKMYFLLKMGIFHCYVSLPECNDRRGLPCILISWLFSVPKDLVTSLRLERPFVFFASKSMDLSASPQPTMWITFRRWLSPWESCTMGTHVNHSFFGVIRQTHI